MLSGFFKLFDNTKTDSPKTSQNNSGTVSDLPIITACNNINLSITGPDENYEFDFILKMQHVYRVETPHDMADKSVNSDKQGKISICENNPWSIAPLSIEKNGLEKLLKILYRFLEQNPYRVNSNMLLEINTAANNNNAFGITHSFTLLDPELLKKQYEDAFEEFASYINKNIIPMYRERLDQQTGNNLKLGR